MKKLMTTMVALAAITMAIAMVACNKKGPQTVYQVTDLPELFNGEYAYHYDAAALAEGERKVADSVQIAGGTFKFEFPADANQEAFISFGQHSTSIALEEGEIIYKYVEGEGGEPEFELVSAPEGGLNSKVEQFKKELDTELTPINERYKEVVTQMQAVTEEEEMAPLQEQLDQVRKDMVAKLNEVAQRYYQGNENNYVGLVAFQAMAFETDAEMIALYEQSGDIIKNNPSLKRQYETALAAQKTQVGGSFIDYELTNENEEKVALSSFREEGNYLVVDFFASWCGPCKASMPILSEIFNNYGAKGVNVVSIAVWDKAPDYATAVTDHNIVWSHAFDKDSEGAKVYGVAGVPTFLLFSPEGEILVRGHDVTEVKAKLDELIGA